MTHFGCGAAALQRGLPLTEVFFESSIINNTTTQIIFHLMNKSILLTLATVLLMLGLSACTDDTIGQSITDTRSTVLEDSSFTITGTSVPNTRLHARTSQQLLGKVNATGYGTLTSDVVTELMPAFNIDTLGTKEEWVDSCRLTLRLNLDGFTGDSLVPMRVSVYQLKKALPDVIYSDFDPSGYYDESTLLGSTSYSAKSATVTTEVTSSGTLSYREMHVKLPVEFARSMFRLYKQDPEAFSTPENFKKHYPGLYITTSYGSGRVMNYYDTEVQAFYRQHAQLTDTTDTIYPAQRQSYCGSTPEVVTNNNLKLEPAQSVKQMVADGQAIVMGPAGYEVNVKFPIEDILATYRKNTADGLAIVNTLHLEIPVEKIKNQYDIAPPAYLLMVKKGMKDTFFEGDSLTNSKDSFYATYSSTTGKYTFTGLRSYFQNILDNEGGVPSDDDVNFVITPIDVTTYTSSGSYSYYYYSKPQTIVTKIAPSVSQPALAKLRLDKAKIRFIYSKQSLY